MRNYWLRIALGAFGVFAVGMLIWTVFNRGRHAVTEMVESSDPITIPLALIPFKVDGRPLGTLRQVQILRSDPERVRAVNFRVRLADSVKDVELEHCVLVMGGPLEHVDAQHAFSCVAEGDTAGADLAPVGEVHTQRGSTVVLFAKAGALDSIKIDLGHADSVAEAHRAYADSIVEAEREFADSLREVEQERADSIREVNRERADSIRSAAEATADSIRAHADSVIQASRARAQQSRQGTSR